VTRRGGVDQKYIPERDIMKDKLDFETQLDIVISHLQDAIGYIKLCKVMHVGSVVEKRLYIANSRIKWSSQKLEGILDEVIKASLSKDDPE
jgi:hypothetical protein